MGLVVTLELDPMTQDEKLFFKQLGGWRLLTDQGLDAHAEGVCEESGRFDRSSVTAAVSSKTSCSNSPPKRPSVQGRKFRLCRNSLSKAGLEDLDLTRIINCCNASSSLRAHPLNQLGDSDHLDHSREIEGRCCQRCLRSRTA